MEKKTVDIELPTEAEVQELLDEMEMLMVNAAMRLNDFMNELDEMCAFTTQLKEEIEQIRKEI